MKNDARILIVEDEIVNRMILKRLLGLEYEIYEAGNGQEGLDVLEAHGAEISAILLDIMMPVMNGYEFMRRIRGTKYASIPLIVMTGEADPDLEQKALEAGAWDFITKPYRPRVLLSRLKNSVARSQIRLLDQLRYTSEHDPLTGLYNRSHMFSFAHRLIAQHTEETFAFVRIDIDRFRLLNSFWGEQNGNRFLIHFAKQVEKLVKPYPLASYGRIEADIFCVCLPFHKEELEAQLHELIAALGNFDRNYLIEPSVGIYVVEHGEALAPETLYLRASLAVNACKYRYQNHIAYYTRDMEESLVREQAIISEMSTALQDEQFEVYLQPKYNMQTMTPYGAEALVRWRHPEKGMISPGEFIPVFERNGFIGKLDNYIWEKVCQLLRRWLDEGRKPAPISVNMSRVDLFNPHLTSILTELIRKYDIPAALLNLELTESAYMDEPEMMSHKIQELHQAGFHIMMDDFGSGFSSLNTLKDISVDYLKIDMKFLTGDHQSSRSQRILASVVRMAGWLELPVIVEGVETREQCDFLRSIGCGYIQGYYFARPMPVREYEKLVDDTVAQPIQSRSDGHDELVSAIWSSNPETAFFIDSFPIAVAVAEVEEARMNLLRVNGAYRQLFGTDMLDTFSVFPDIETYERAFALAKRTAQSKQPFLCLNLYPTLDGGERLCHTAFRYMGTNEGTAVVLIALLPASEPNADETKPPQMSAQQLQQLCELLNPLFDTVRLLDPSDASSLELREGELLPVAGDPSDAAWHGTELPLKDSDASDAIDEHPREHLYTAVSHTFELTEASGSHPITLRLSNLLPDSQFLTRCRSLAFFDKLNEKIYRDDLTGVYNRRYLSELVNLSPQLANKRLALILFDLHRFKGINDRYGHLAGDAVLTSVAGALSKRVRRNDSVVRYGGDEFIVLLPDCAESVVQRKVAVLQNAISAICFGDTPSQTICADAGYAYTDAFKPASDTLKQMIDEADRHIYRQKHSEA